MINRADERPLEYAFVWSMLGPILSHYQVRILDVGGAESRLSKVLAELGHDVTVIDINPVDHGRAKYVQANILTYDFPENTFDIITAISTIEHIGLEGYGQTVRDEYGDIKAVEKIYRWLKPGGLAVVTLPYGKPHHPPTFERVYDRGSLVSRILRVKDWQVLNVSYACKDPRRNEWGMCIEQEARDTDGCVMLLLRKPTAKLEHLIEKLDTLIQELKEASDFYLARGELSGVPDW
jgi:SAM-dependent methyltransferase